MSTDKILLIINEDRNVRQTLAVIFRRAGYQVITAVDFSQARWYLKDHKCHLIVLDTSVPDLKEGELAEPEKLKVFNGIPMILMLGNSPVEQFGAITQARNYVVLKKPVDPSEIIGCAKGLLN